MSEAITRHIRVRVNAHYVEDESVPEDDHYFFTYHVTITNEGNIPAQLISRHWIISDGNGGREEVKGAGVVGYQPVLNPGESFEYSSFCPLKTPVGTMQGTYQMIDAQGNMFDAEIARFSLIKPGVMQ
ncbi:Co2+/Mg2+ efflux protein ApaG [bacterium]|nr:Co2+/Mg2+ efflux protein ApaG [bacterium]